MEYTEQAARIQSITEEPNGVVTTVDLAEAVPRIVNENERVSEADVSVETPAYAAFEANHMLDIAIDELVSNAIEHNDSSAPELSVSVTRTGGPTGTTRVSITDNGPGIHPKTLEVLEQGREDQLLHMNGMGLWMVYWTTIESGGSLDIETAESGTRVTITLPTALSISGGSMARAFG
jgi:signal transduction histidine kinase